MQESTHFFAARRSRDLRCLTTSQTEEKIDETMPETRTWESLWTFSRIF
jgi:hypothetical protein